VERWIVLHRTGWLDPVFEGLSYIGTWGAVWLAVAVVLALLRGRPWIVLWVAIADLSANLISYGIREAVGRPRPPLVHSRSEPLVSTPHSGSFPSGHTTVAFACATVLTAIAPNLAVPLFVLAFAIGFSRVYVGVHYPLDVIGGAALGVLVGLAVTTLRRRVEGRRR
jgi:undecaprenyl-diphosphatase